MIPLRDDNPSQTEPVVTRALIGLNVAAFLLELSTGPNFPRFVAGWGIVPSELVGAIHGHGSLGFELATVLTSMFLHGGWVHLIGNMWYLWIFGDNIEDRLGHLRYLCFYLAAGVVSAAVQVISSPDSPVPTVGASGAIAGVLGAYAMAYPRARVVTLVPLIFIFQVIALPALVVLGLWFVMQLFSGTLSLGVGATGGIAWWAHIAGFAFGYVVMAAAGGARPAPSRAWIER